MSGVMMAATGVNAGGGGGGGGTGNYKVTVGIATVAVFKSTINYLGYGTAGSPGGAFGAIDITTWGGFAIIGIYWLDLGQLTHLIVTGDASALTPVLKVAGVNQNLGAGAFSGGQTTFQSSGVIADPFTPVGSVKAVTIA